MAKKCCTFKIITPRKSEQIKDPVKFNEKFQQQLIGQSVNVSVNQVSKLARWQTQQTVSIVATFFQRVCARTPIDEVYKIGRDRTTREGVLIESLHIPDDVYCRYDWYIEKDGIRITAEELHDSYPDIFDTVNDKQSIKAIENYITFAFGDKLNLGKGSEFSIGNNNPHFQILEYGGYKKDGEIKEGIKADEGHGVKNKHSVQAPVGMERISRMELESLFSNVFAIPSSYKNQKKVNKNLSDEQLKRLLGKFKANSHLKLSDIKEFIDL